MKWVLHGFTGDVRAVWEHVYNDTIPVPDELKSPAGFFNYTRVPDTCHLYIPTDIDHVLIEHLTKRVLASCIKHHKTMNKESI